MALSVAGSYSVVADTPYAASCQACSNDIEMVIDWHGEKEAFLKEEKGISKGVAPRRCKGQEKGV